MCSEKFREQRLRDEEKMGTNGSAPDINKSQPHSSPLRASLKSYRATSTQKPSQELLLGLEGAGLHLPPPGPGGTLFLKAITLLQYLLKAFNRHTLGTQKPPRGAAPKVDNDHEFFRQF